MSNTPRLKDLVITSGIDASSMDADTFFQHLRAQVPEIQARYVRNAMNILDGKTIEAELEKLGSKVEPLILVDEEDIPYRNKDGWWASEFRKDCIDYGSLPESVERTILGRVVMFILEDNQGNIIITKRASGKSHPGVWEVPGGHVGAGYEYLEACIKELREEGSFVPDSLSESDRLFKHKKIASNKIPGTHGRGNILVTYRVRVPSIASLTFDPNEIEKGETLTPGELLLAIKDNFIKGEKAEFEPNHAFLYLEYLEKVHSLDVSGTKTSIQHNLSPMDTFGANEEGLNVA